MASGEVCALCGHGREVQNVCGIFYSQKLATGEILAAHKKCMQYSSGLNQKYHDNFGGFDVEDVKKEIKRGEQLYCFWCKKKKKRARGATSGCELKRCPKSFHFYCAHQDPKSKICRRRSLDMTWIFWIFCSDEHKNRHLKTDEGRNGESCDETDEEEEAQVARQSRPAGSGYVDDKSSTPEEEEPSDEDDTATSDGDRIETASSSDQDRGSSSSHTAARERKLKAPVTQSSHEEDEHPENGNKADTPDSDENDPEESLPPAATHSRKRQHFTDREELDQNDHEEAVPQETDSAKKKTVLKISKERGTTRLLQNQEDQTKCLGYRSRLGGNYSRTARKPSKNLSKTMFSEAHPNSVPLPPTKSSFHGASSALDSSREAAVQPETEDSDIAVPDSCLEATSCGRQPPPGAMDAVGEDPVRLGADQMLNIGDPAATPSHRTGLRRSANEQSQRWTGSQETEENDPESDLQRECLRSEIKKNNIIIDTAQKKLALMEGKQRREEERKEREEKQHNALIEKIQKEMALMNEQKTRNEERQKREEEFHDISVEKIKKEFQLTVEKTQKETELIEERQKRGEERRKREEENHKREEEMYLRLMDRSTRQEYYDSQE